MANKIGFKIGRWGMLEDPRGAHVTFGTLIGEVKGCYLDQVTGCWRLKVKHFDGSDWPKDPPASTVVILEREYETGDRSFRAEETARRKEVSP